MSISNSILSITNFIFYWNKYRFIIVFFTSLPILYNLLYIYLLVKFSFLKKQDIATLQYIPNFLKKELLEIERISKSKNLNNYLDLYVKYTLIFFIMFLIILFNFYLIN